MSQRTKHFTVLYWLFATLSFLLTLGPLLFYIVKGYIEADVTKEKVALTGILLCAIILVAINFLMKHQIRSTVWLILLGIYYCVDNIMPLLLMIAIGTILDEFIVSPLKKSFKNKKTINREIDKRF